MRVRSREHLGGEFDSILTCVSWWRVAVRDCLVSELIPAGNAFILCRCAVLVFCCNLSLAKVVQLMYHWAHQNASFTTLHHEMTFSSHTTVDWKNFCRDIYAEHFLANPVTIGGPGIVVEIDESLFCRRKYNVGRAIAQQWVFGGLEVGTPARKGLLVAVPRRDAATLLPVIQQYVLPGSTIVSDCWRAYNTLPQLGYQHLTVNRNIQFVNPQNGACTNHIECYWKNAKMRNKRECGTARSQLDSYLIEYMWRTQFGNNPLHNFVAHVRAVYSTQ